MRAGSQTGASVCEAPHGRHSPAADPLLRLLDCKLPKLLFLLEDSNELPPGKDPGETGGCGAPLWFTTASPPLQGISVKTSPNSNEENQNTDIQEHLLKH